MASRGAPPSGPLVQPPSPPAGGAAATDRAAAFAAGPAPIPRRVVIIGAAVLVTLAVGGTLLERLFSAVGLNPQPRASAHVSSPAVQPVKASLAALPGGAGLAHALGAEVLSANSAPALSLIDQHGTRFTLASQQGRVVVLSFFDSACNDACPVVGRILAAADRDLGTRAARVSFVTVNSDPRATGFTSTPAAFVRTGLENLNNAVFLTGTIAKLNPIWTEYGLTIDVASTGQVAHNNTVYLIDRAGDLRYLVTPPADEARNGTYHLAPAEQARIAGGLATYARSLLAGPRSGAHASHP